MQTMFIAKATVLFPIGRKIIQEVYRNSGITARFIAALHLSHHFEVVILSSSNNKKGDIFSSKAHQIKMT